jgi:phosphonate transport system substrate-binding protein
MSARTRFAGRRTLSTFLVAVTLLAAACGSDDATTDATATDDDSGGATAATLTIGAIPDQEPERLQRTYDLLTDYLESELSVDVEYLPVTDYQGAVTGFRVGDLDAVWFGALSGIQARLEVDGADAVAQRDIDEQFTSVFIAGADTGIETIGDVAGLAALSGRSFTFGSESSTSSRLMPQAFLEQAGLDIDADFAGPPGFAGSHDAVIEVVESGSFEVGVVAAQVWDDRLAEGAFDADRVVEIFRTPAYPNYHWVAQPTLDERFGEGFADRFVAALMALDPSVAEHAEILELFGADSFITTQNSNYDEMESVARSIGLITG